MKNTPKGAFALLLYLSLTFAASAQWRPEWGERRTQPVNKAQVFARIDRAIVTPPDKGPAHYSRMGMNVEITLFPADPNQIISLPYEIVTKQFSKISHSDFVATATHPCTGGGAGVITIDPRIHGQRGSGTIRWSYPPFGPIIAVRYSWDSRGRQLLRGEHND